MEENKVQTRKTANTCGCFSVVVRFSIKNNILPEIKFVKQMIYVIRRKVSAEIKGLMAQKTIYLVCFVLVELCKTPSVKII